VRSLLAGAAAAALLFSGCGSGEDWSAPRAKPFAVGELGPGFVDPRDPPAPEATIRPRPGSWSGVHPSEGYRVVLLTSGEDDATRTLEAAVREWAQEEDVSLKTVDAPDPARYVPRIVDAMELEPDLVVATGTGLVDPLALVTASHLDQQFLVLGAEVAEPTFNVTAANWVGASFRGEGLAMADHHDPASFTPERAGRALRAGVAAVLTGWTGIVVRT
jgi:basic membrane lipoprotein Med (substrate-binding protein (PBP1-ABC) superfamily)